MAFSASTTMLTRPPDDAPIFEPPTGGQSAISELPSLRADRPARCIPSEPHIYRATSPPDMAAMPPSDNNDGGLDPKMALEPAVLSGQPPVLGFQALQPPSPPGDLRCFDR
ncbi:MAG: hypothetical protein IT210_18460 [Armatimonadetes bacterium]|nr:hypothetical protein [Armatimonadota bacterium]